MAVLPLHEGIFLNDTSSPRRIAFLGGFVPRQCGIATFTADMVDSLRGAFGLGRSTKSKIAPWLLLAICSLPALVTGIVINVTGARELAFPMPNYAAFVYPLLILYVGGQAPASVSRDLRFRVTTLYFSRPLRRGDYVLAKACLL